MTVSEYLYIPLIIWAVAQGIKFSLAMLNGRYKPALLFSSGGMPSVHSATVSALATVALIEGGPSSPLFGITGIFAAIVMYDSLGVRRSAGEQAKTLNILIDDLLQTGTLKAHGRYGHLKEILGHRPLEVVVGAALGVSLTAILMYQSVFVQAPWLQTIPSSVARTIEIMLAVFLILFGGVMWLSARRSGSRLRHFTPFLRQILISNVVVACIFASLAFLQSQQVVPAGNWVVVIGTLAIFFAWHLALWYRLLVDGALRNPRVKNTPAENRRLAWLNKARKKSGRNQKKA